MRPHLFLCFLVASTIQGNSSLVYLGARLLRNLFVFFFPFQRHQLCYPLKQRAVFAEGAHCSRSWWLGSLRLKVKAGSLARVPGGHPKAGGQGLVAWRIYSWSAAPDGQAALALLILALHRYNNKQLFIKLLLLLLASWVPLNQK